MKGSEFSSNISKSNGMFGPFLFIWMIVVYISLHPCFPCTRNVSHHIAPAEGSGQPVCERTPTESFLQQLLTYADSVTNWVSAEVVICDGVKVRGDVSHEVTGSSGENSRPLLSQPELWFLIGRAFSCQSQTFPICAFCSISALMLGWIIDINNNIWALNLNQLFINYISCQLYLTAFWENS